MKERLMPILSLIVLFALVGSMAYFGQQPDATEVNEQQGVVATTNTEDLEKPTETGDVKKEEIPFRHVEVPELVLTGVGDAVANNYNYATLDRYNVDDIGVLAVVSTDAGISDVAYELLDENGEKVHGGSKGLSFGVSGDTHEVYFNKAIFDNVEEQDLELKPEWKNYKVRFRLITGYDTEIIVEPVA